MNLSRDTAEALQELTRRKGTTVTDSIRRAIAIWKFLTDQQDNGARLILREEDGAEREVVLLEG